MIRFDYFFQMGWNHQLAKFFFQIDLNHGIWQGFGDAQKHQSQTKSCQNP